MSTVANIVDPDEMQHIMLHFIRVYTVCKGKTRYSDKRIHFLKKIYNLTPLDMYDGLYQVYCIRPLVYKGLKSMFCLISLISIVTYMTV